MCPRAEVVSPISMYIQAMVGCVLYVHAMIINLEVMNSRGENGQRYGTSQRREKTTDLMLLQSAV